MAAENIIFGMGGGLHTSVNRDTQRNAFKCSAQYRNGEWVNIYKKPLDSSKKSKKGRFKLIREENSYKTVPITDSRRDELQTVFKDGQLLIDDTFENIKNRTGSFTYYPLKI